MKLRDYQVDALRAIEQMQSKTNKQVLVMATGLGKTVIFAHLINNRVTNHTNKKALVLAHREELLDQAKDKILRVEPTLTVAVEQANRSSNGEQVIIASVQTIGRSNSDRIKKFKPEEFNTIIVDEAHHASASTYRNVLRYFGVLKGEHDINPNILLLGVTATPNRMDNEGIDKIFDETAFRYGIAEGIQNGWLARIRAFRVDTRTELQGVKTQAGDFAIGELSDKINNPERNGLVVKTYKELLGSKQALVFAADIGHAEALQKTFQEEGIISFIITGNTPKDQRQKALKTFYEKKIKVMVNCMVLTEGYDNDTIDAIMMARPTQSSILYQQMVGRGTRTHDDKAHLTVVDFVDNTSRHQLKTASSLLGVEGKINFQGKDILEAKVDIDRIRELNPNYNLDHLDLNRIRYIMEEVDLLAGLGTPEAIREFTQFNWYRYGVDAYRINLGDQRYVLIERTVTGQWKAYFDIFDTITKKTYRQELGETTTLDQTVSRADRYIFNNYKETLPLVSNAAKWRKEPITEAQQRFLRRFRGKYNVNEELIDQLDKGTASNLMTKIITMNEGRYNN